MDREQLFAKTLEQVRKTAREQGNSITQEQVQEAFAPLELGEEQLQMVYDYLLKHRIGIGQSLNAEELLSSEERDYLQDYLNDLEQLDTCTAGELEAYTISAMAGEAQAQHRLVEHYLKDVVDIAKLYAGQGVLLEDLIGEGNVALSFGVTMLGSLEKPSEVQGMLGKMIMDAMEDHISEYMAEKKKDRQVLDKVNSVAKQARELSEELRRKVTVEELAQETKLTEEDILEAIRMSGFQMEYIEDER